MINKSKLKLRQVGQGKFHFFLFVILILVVFGISVLVYQVAYAEKIFPGVWVGDYELGRKTREEAKEFLNQKINAWKSKGLSFVFEDKTLTLAVNDKNSSLDELVQFDIDGTLDLALAIGRDKFLGNLQEQTSALFLKKKIPVVYKLEKEELKQKLEEKFFDPETLPKDAQLAPVFDENNEAVGLEIVPEKKGLNIHYGKAILETETVLRELVSEPITLSVSIAEPEIRAVETGDALLLAKAIFENSPFVLFYENQVWEIDKKKVAKWLGFTLTDSSDEASVETPRNKVTVKIKEKPLSDFLDTIASAVAVKMQNAKFELADEGNVASGKRVKEFQPSITGKELNKSASLEAIQRGIVGLTQEKIELEVRNLQPSVTTAGSNTLGIKELLGVGESGFEGSPKNREHNIKVGAERLHGVLIAPNEEFSLVGALGKVGPETGYLSELVIKEDRTIPEYGGGLCQVATTIFRSALAVGLPITERKNHSYRVPYYEPAGRDATIYIPHPDLKFFNDTGNWILIQTKMERTKLYFEFWGSSDGRNVQQTEPIIYNVSPPPPPITIKTTELPPNEKKCVERAHSGASAKFSYTITYSDGRIFDKTFISHYKPWAEVCLVGVPKPSEEKTATSTIETSSSP